MREDHKIKGNTVGSRQELNNQDLAYIAGFLDGDGSIMMQIKRRLDSKFGWRIMITICFYQDARHIKPLRWIRRMFHIGYISVRNDHMAEYRINGFKETRRVLQLLKPYIRFKKKQVAIVLTILPLLCEKKLIEMSRKERKNIADSIISLREHNYQSHQRRYTDESIKALLDF